MQRSGYVPGPAFATSCFLVCKHLVIEEVVEARGEGSRFEEAMNANVDLIAEFVQGLRYQVAVPRPTDAEHAGA